MCVLILFWGRSFCEPWIVPSVCFLFIKWLDTLWSPRTRENRLCVGCFVKDGTEGSVGLETHVRSHLEGDLLDLVTRVPGGSLLLCDTVFTYKFKTRGLVFECVF